MKTLAIALCAFGLGTVSANADGLIAPVNRPNPRNARVLEFLDRALTRFDYYGVTAHGAPCHVEVSKEMSVGGSPVSQLFINGYEPIPGSWGANPVYRASGFFQLGVFSPMYRVVGEGRDSHSYSVSVEASQNMGDAVVGLPTWQGQLALSFNDAGALTAISMDQQVDDPISGGMTVTSFSCGAANQQDL